jgi:hypothetical protein
VGREALRARTYRLMPAVPTAETHTGTSAEVASSAAGVSSSVLRATIWVVEGCSAALTNDNRQAEMRSRRTESEGVGMGRTGCDEADATDSAEVASSAAGMSS